MNTLDIVIVLLFLPGVIRGATKGFLQQVISLGGLLVSALIAKQLYPKVAIWLTPHLEIAENAINILSFALALIAVMLILIVLAKLLTKVAEMATLGWLNRVLGVALAMFTTALILGLIATVFDSLNENFNILGESTIVKDSLLYGYLRDFAVKAFPYLKQLITPAAEAVTSAL